MLASRRLLREQKGKKGEQENKKVENRGTEPLMLTLTLRSPGGFRPFNRGDVDVRLRALRAEIRGGISLAAASEVAPVRDYYERPWRGLD